MLHVMLLDVFVSVEEREIVRWCRTPIPCRCSGKRRYGKRMVDLPYRRDAQVAPSDSYRHIPPESTVAKMATLLYDTAVHIIGQERLVEFWEKHPDARTRLQTWYYDAKSANWSRPADIKAVYRNASILPNNRVVFNIKGNHYRLVVLVEYANKRVRIRFVGTHEEYDRINAAEI